MFGASAARARPVRPCRDTSTQFVILAMRDNCPSTGPFRWAVNRSTCTGLKLLIADSILPGLLDTEITEGSGCDFDLRLARDHHWHCSFNFASQGYCKKLPEQTQASPTKAYRVEFPTFRRFTTPNITNSGLVPTRIVDIPRSSCMLLCHMSARSPSALI